MNILFLNESSLWNELSCCSVSAIYNKNLAPFKRWGSWKCWGLHKVLNPPCSAGQSGAPQSPFLFWKHLEPSLPSAWPRQGGERFLWFTASLLRTRIPGNHPVAATLFWGITAGLLIMVSNILQAHQVPLTDATCQLPTASLSLFPAVSLSDWSQRSLSFVCFKGRGGIHSDSCLKHLPRHRPWKEPTPVFTSPQRVFRDLPAAWSGIILLISRHKVDIRIVLPKQPAVSSVSSPTCSAVGPVVRWYWVSFFRKQNPLCSPDCLAILVP